MIDLLLWVGLGLCIVVYAFVVAVSFFFASRFRQLSTEASIMLMGAGLVSTLGGWVLAVLLFGGML